MKKFLPYLKHLAFVIAIGILPFGYDDSMATVKRNGEWQNILLWEDFFIYPAISFLIIFFLWKSNYFTRNK